MVVIHLAVGIRGISLELFLQSISLAELNHGQPWFL